MPQDRLRVPKYRHYKPKNLAVVRINGHDCYLGRYESGKSREKYHRLIAEWLASSGRQVSSVTPSPLTIPKVVTINQLLLTFFRHVRQRYRKNGTPTSEVRSFRTALRPVRQLYGRQPVTSFGPLALKACRQKLIEAGYCRRRINQHVGRIRFMFRWGVACELVPETVWRSLCAVEGLHVGEAPETEPVKPVPEEHVNAIQPHVTPQIWAMVGLQLWTGCRPGEACLFRTIDLSTQGTIWEYRPHSHKTEHHGKGRVIYLGPHAQEIIKPWLKTDLNAYIFSPKEARETYLAERHKRRKTPVPPSQLHRQRKAKPKRCAGDRYRVSTYGHAIQRACDRADVPPWSPNQLRHNAATRIRAAYGIEAARIILGHSSVATSEIYAEIDAEKAREIAGRLG